jgi:hypothetical protein
VSLHSTSASSKHITSLHQHTNATLEQEDSKTYLAVYLPVDFSVVNCVRYSPRCNMMMTDIIRHQTCVLQHKSSTRTRGVTDQERSINETAWTNWQTEKVTVPRVGDKPYSLETRDIRVGVEATGAWNWPHLKLAQKVATHGYNKYIDIRVHTWLRA